MMVKLVINVTGWVCTDVSVEDDWKPGDEIPDESLQTALNMGGWDDSHFEAVGAMEDGRDG